MRGQWQRCCGSAFMRYLFILFLLVHDLFEKNFLSKITLSLQVYFPQLIKENVGLVYICSILCELVVIYITIKY